MVRNIGDRSPESPETPALSVVVPCFNESECLQELYQRVSAVCKTEVGERYEFVLINDGSTDDTWQIIAKLTELDPRVVGIKLARNFGHQLALTAGLTICRGERILIIDADLQDPPEILPDMMQLMDRGAAVVYGQRRSRGGESWFKKLCAATFYRILDRVIDVKIPVDTGDFRLMSRKALDILNQMPEQHRFIRGMVSWIGLSQVPVHYDRDARFAGVTKYPFTKLVRFALDAITGFSTRPLRVASYFAIVFGLFGLAALVYTVYSWASDQVVHGWTSVMGVILILGSVQLFFISILGEYLGRMFFETKRRPLFIIDTVLSHAELNHADDDALLSAQHDTAGERLESRLESR